MIVIKKPPKPPSNDDGGCFSSQTMVDAMERGTVPIHQVKVGDFIKSRNDGAYSKVFGFHKNESAEAFFH